MRNKILFFSLAMMLFFTACGNANTNNINSVHTSTKQNSSTSTTATISNINTATAPAPIYSKRVIENGTAITITVGDVVLPATLNNSRASQELISRLPYTIKLHRYAHDYCGVMSNPLPYNEADVHNGWLDGDIDFARDANYFTILFEDGDNSQKYGHQITLGKLDGDLNAIKALGSNIELLIELAQ